jgi:hypothetical protein
VSLVNFATTQALRVEKRTEWEGLCLRKLRKQLAQTDRIPLLRD